MLDVFVTGSIFYGDKFDDNITGSYVIVPVHYDMNVVKSVAIYVRDIAYEDKIISSISEEDNGEMWKFAEEMVENRIKANDFYDSNRLSKLALNEALKSMSISVD